ncbi:major tail protein [Fructilactobacillus fructivorans]|uniref:Phage tail protein n=1 Tax=Fructilactobacillus fructivorans TaxID=1614 RepID=A0AAE6P0X6_9LACO|nr:major tail protein [Fructilactobacillus fructivorans]KRK58503.1 major tail protein [Fructilactobacillus fructivorans]QFX92513.1 hypothetical protein LF543_02610 [Fructilactobacillus fructivorans]RDV65892.1 hypothetical protein DXU76_01800 [Fructilactobacillus fructivorans]
MARKDGGTVGIKTAKFALLRDDGTIDPTFGDNGVYTVTSDKDGGMTTANISGLGQSVQRVWGNNQNVETSYGKAQPSISLGSNFLSKDIKNRLLGRKKQDNGAWSLEGDPQSTLVALDVVSSDSGNNDVHFGFKKGHLTTGDVNLQTSNENQSRQADSMTYTPINSGDDDDGMEIGWTGDTSFDINKFFERYFSELR